MTNKTARIPKIVLFASGKGGVGKTTLAINTSIALSRYKKTALIDADVYGFCAPKALGLNNITLATRGDKIIPPEAFGIKVISIGMFLKENDAIAWRGPMLKRTLDQFLYKTDFSDTEIIIIDMPPGTGDIALSIAQSAHGANVIIITTPQKQSNEVALRSALLAAKLKQNILGAVENMSGFFKPSYINLLQNDVYKQTGLKIDILSNVDLNLSLAQSIDGGFPFMGRFREGRKSLDNISGSNSLNISNNADLKTKSQIETIAKEILNRVF